MAFVFAEIEIGAPITEGWRLSLETDGSLTPTGAVFAQIEMGAAQQGARIPTIVLDATPVQGMTLPLIAFTEAAPSSLELTATGGVEVGGAAAKSFFLNGSPVVDASTYNIMPNGGAAVSGAAPANHTQTKHYEIYPLGGAKLTGTAPVSVSWTRHSMVGGVQISGEATVATTSGVTAPAGTTAFSIAAALKPLIGTVYSTNWGTAKLATSMRAPVVSITTVGGDLFTVSVALPQVGVGITAYAGNAGEVQASTPLVAASVTVVATTVAFIATTIPVVGSRLTGYTAVQASINAALPVVASAFSTSQVVTHVTVLVTNLVTKAITTYEQYAYNSYAVIDGEYYAAGPTGLYKIDTGDTDVGAPIVAKLRFGQNDFGNTQQKRVSDFYAVAHTDGELTVRAYIDEQAPLEYALKPYGVATLNQRRTPIGKGARGIHWQFEIENTDGCYFDISALSIAVADSTRRI